MATALNYLTVTHQHDSWVVAGDNLSWAAGSTVDDVLRECGVHGWELVTVDRGPDDVTYFFKKATGSLVRS